MDLIVKQGSITLLCVRPPLILSFGIFTVPQACQQTIYQLRLTVAFHYSIFLFGIINVLSDFDEAPSGGWQLLLLLALESVPNTLAPLFILSMWELYARDTYLRLARRR